MGTSLTGVATAGGGWQLGNGNPGEAIIRAQAAELTYVTAAGLTLTAAQVIAGIITFNNGTGETLTLPTGTLMDAAVPNAQVGHAFDFTVICLGAGSATLAVGTGWTAVGALVVAQNHAIHYRARKTGVGTYTVYQYAGS